VPLEEDLVAAALVIRARKKWLKPTSKRVAAEAYVEMCPPMPDSSRFARTTIAIAFQRRMLLIRRSISRLPGKRGWFAAEMVLRYGVCSFAGSEMPRRAISIWRARRSSAARSPPRVSRT
jgi:hypothetical protein